MVPESGDSEYGCDGVRGSSQPILSNGEEKQMEPPFKKKYIFWIGMLACIVSLIVLLPAVFADYFTSRLLVSPNYGKKSNLSRMLQASKTHSIVFHGEKNALLHGWLHISRHSKHTNRRLLFYLHDFGADHTQGRIFIEILLSNGFDVFAFDQRGHGRSQGKIGFWPSKQARDLRSIRDYLFELFPKRWDSQIGVCGYGLGATVAFLAASRDSSIRSIVAFDPIVVLKEHLVSQLKDLPVILRNLTLRRVERLAGLNLTGSRDLFPTRKNLSLFLVKSKSLLSQVKIENLCKERSPKCRIYSRKRRGSRDHWLTLSARDRESILNDLKDSLGMLLSKVLHQKKHPKKVDKKGPSVDHFKMIWYRGNSTSKPWRRMERPDSRPSRMGWKKRFHIEKPASRLTNMMPRKKKFFGVSVKNQQPSAATVPSKVDLKPLPFPVHPFGERPVWVKKKPLSKFNTSRSFKKNIMFNFKQNRSGTSRPAGIIRSRLREKK